MSNLDRAQQLSAHGRHEKAVPHARRAVADDPDDPDGWLVLSYVLLEDGHGDEALSTSRRALARFPDDPRVLLQMGALELEFGSIDQATTNLRSCLTFEPDDPVAHATLAKVYAAANQHDQAAHHADRAVALAPDDPYTHRTRGDIHLAAEVFGAAAQAYRTSLQLDPEDVHTHINLSLALAHQGDTDGTFDHALTAARLDPTDETATGNVVAFGQAIVGGGALVAWIASRVLRWLTDSELVSNATAIMIGAGALGAWLWVRQRRWQSLPDTVQQALRAHRRKVGPGPMWVWLVVGYFGLLVVAGTAARLIDETGGPQLADVVAVLMGVAGLVVASHFVMRKWPYADPRALEGRSWAWIALSIISSMAVATGLWLLTSPEGSNATLGSAILMITATTPWAAGTTYVAWKKRRRTSP